MKKVTKLIVVLMFLLFIVAPLRAQTYSRGEQTIIQPSQVMVENYTAITLGKEVTDDPNGNRFDRSNLYSYLQIVYDNTGKDHQILFQTNFSGKILFLAYSNNLSAIFNNQEKPLNVFANCIRHINENLSSVQNANAAIKCIIERLNYCSN